MTNKQRNIKKINIDNISILYFVWFQIITFNEIILLIFLFFITY